MLLTCVPVLRVDGPHYIYLEWLKYNTAKPLLYMVYRTRN